MATNAINITKTLEKLDALNLGTRFHSAKHPLPVQRKRLEAYCKELGIDPIYAAPKGDRKFYPSMI